MLELTDQFLQLKQSGKLNDYIAKKRKKNAAKDHRWVGTSPSIAENTHPLITALSCRCHTSEKPTSDLEWSMQLQRAFASSDRVILGLQLSRVSVARVRWSWSCESRACVRCRRFRH